MVWATSTLRACYSNWQEGLEGSLCCVFEQELLKIYTQCFILMLALQINYLEAGGTWCLMFVNVPVKEVFWNIRLTMGTFAYLQCSVTGEPLPITCSIGYNLFLLKEGPKYCSSKQAPWQRKRIQIDVTNVSNFILRVR